MLLSIIEADPQCSNHHHPHHRDHVDHHHHHHQTTPISHLSPTFSIRDYVFTARSKDIKTSWPFSLKNLQLCLKHDVKDVLPPFQSLDAIRNQICRRCNTVDIPQDDISNNDNPASRFLDNDDHDSLHSNTTLLNTDQIKAKLPLDATTSCRSGDSFLFPSTTTSVCQSEIEESVPTVKSPLQTDTSLEAASVEVEPEPSGPCTVVPHKPKSTSRASGKNKCKLIVKFSSHSDRSSAEDIASNCTTQSEAMASKICPVCKTFSSSSNTTLNAHIDQCLSAESSTPKWTMDSKLISTRHRVKPRKTRLMVDIYSTALPCTLEDLDRRNGSNWASGASNFPTPDPESDKSETPVEDEKEQRSIPLDDHTSCVDVGAVYIDSNGIKLRILSKSDDAPKVPKVIEHLRPRKPPFKAGKGSKFLSARKKKRRASKLGHYLKLAQTKKLLFSNPPSQVSGDQGNRHVAEGSHDMQKHVNPGNSGTLRQWPRSKRSGVVKKLNDKRNWNGSSEGLRVETQLPRLNSSSLATNQLLNLSGNPVSENIFYKAQVSPMVEPSLGINEVGSSLSGATISSNVERSLNPMNQNARQLRKERTSRLLKSAAISTPVPAPIHRQPSICRSEAMRSSRPVAVKSNVCLGTDEEIVPWDSEAVRAYDLEHNFAANHQSGTEDMHQENPPCRNTRSNTGQNTGVLSVSERKEAIVSECQQLQFHFRSHGHAMDNMESSMLDKVHDGLSVHGDYQCSLDGINVSQLSAKVAVDETLSTSHKPVDSDTNKMGPLCDVQVLTGSSGPTFVGGQEMFYGVQLGNDMLVRNEHIGEDLNSDIAHGISFPDVDPIPIPGPPGSFLPSPRDMSSEDFQGNSSLTTSRVQSSQDQRDFIDGDSSDSPVSATSTVSNSTAGRYDPEALPSAVSHGSQDKIRSSLSGGSVDSSIDMAVVARSTSFKVNKIPMGFNADTEPCCCQRKERAPNSQESQLLKRRVMLADTETRPYTVEASSDRLLRGPTDSMSPSSSNSILRLMGKNLMVVNRDQDERSAAQINHPSMFGGTSQQQQPHVVYQPNFHPSPMTSQQVLYNNIPGGYSSPSQATRALYNAPVVALPGINHPFSAEAPHDLSRHSHNRTGDGSAVLHQAQFMPTPSSSRGQMLYKCQSSFLQ